MPTSYSWNLVAPPVTGSAPDPGPPVASPPRYSDPRRNQFARGIKFGNVPGGKPENIVHGGTRIFHVNTACNVLQDPIDKGGTSGAIARPEETPDSVRKKEDRNVDVFGNVLYPFTGR
jgi:hypothetical protein